MKSSFVFFLVLLVSSCQSAPTATAVPTNHYIRVGYLPALGSWRDKIAHCAAQIPGITVGTFETAAYSSIDKQSQPDIFLQFPQNLPNSGTAFRIGQEKLFLIVNQANSIDHLTVEQWSSILLGDLAQWSQIGELITDLPIGLWLYPSDNPLSKTLFAEIPTLRPASINANMAPDPLSMLEIISDEISAIGPIPSSWLDTQTTSHKVRVVPLYQDETEVPNALIDVLAVTEPEPDDDIRTLLKCIQRSSN